MWYLQKAWRATPFKWSLLFFILLLSHSAQAQVQPRADSLAVLKDTSQHVEKLDVFDILAETKQLIFGKKKSDTLVEFLHDDNDTIIKNIFSLLPLAQYTPATKLALGCVLNTAFFTGPAYHTNLSAMHSEVAYTMNHQFILVNRSIIWSKGNKYNFVGDWRYDKYPSYTYGLGSHSSIDDKLLLDFHYVRFYQTVYRKIYPALFLGFGYNLDYRFNIVQEGNDPTTDFFVYSGGATSSVSSGPTLNVLYDSRKNPNNPVKGAHYANVIFRQNMEFLGSNTSWQGLIVDARTYIALSSKSHNILALWTYNWFSFNGKVPYLDLPSSYWDSYENQGRGYIQGRFRSRNLISFEAEYRFSITQNRLLAGVVFSNVQSVTNWNTNRFDMFYPAAGAGLRIKINKFTNTNLAIDYAIGINGSNGLFFNLGEVF